MKEKWKCSEQLLIHFLRRVTVQFQKLHFQKFHRYLYLYFHQKQDPSLHRLLRRSWARIAPRWQQLVSRTLSDSLDTVERQDCWPENSDSVRQEGTELRLEWPRHRMLVTNGSEGYPNKLIHLRTLESKELLSWLLLYQNCMKIVSKVYENCIKSVWKLYQKCIKRKKESKFAPLGWNILETNRTVGGLFGYSSVNSRVSLNVPSSKGVSWGLWLGLIVIGLKMVWMWLGWEWFGCDWVENGLNVIGLRMVWLWFHSDDWYNMKEKGNQSRLVSLIQSNTTISRFSPKDDSVPNHDIVISRSSRDSGRRILLKSLEISHQPPSRWRWHCLLLDSDSFRFGFSWIPTELVPVSICDWLDPMFDTIDGKYQIEGSGLAWKEGEEENTNTTASFAPLQVAHSFKFSSQFLQLSPDLIQFQWKEKEREEERKEEESNQTFITNQINY